MARRILRAFAENGDRTAIDDDTQSSGIVNYQQGYPARYSLNPASDPAALRLSRARHNQLWHDLSSNIKEWQEQFAPSFITAEANGGTAFSYPLGIVVYDPDNSNYRRSTVANNTAEVTDNGSWEDYDFSRGGDEAVGSPIPWPLAAAPSGYILMMGQAFNTSTFPLLALAYPSGTLPDLRGEFIRGWDNARGVDPSRALLSAQASANLSHSHGLWGSPALNTNSSVGYLGNSRGIGGAVTAIGDEAYGNTLRNNINPVETVGEAESRPRNIAFNYIVRAA